MLRNIKIISLFLIILCISNLIFANNGTAVYRSNTGTYTISSPKIRNWSSSGIGSYSAEFELPTAGSPIRYALIKYSPVSPKRVIITQSDDGYLDAYTSFDGEEWNVTNNIGQVWTTAPTISSRRFDFEFENATGDLVLVYSVVSTSTTCDLAYRVMKANETTFGPETCIDDTTQATDIQYSWVEAARKPGNSEEIIFVGFDLTDSDAVAYVWNGNSFGNIREITASATATGGYKAIAVAYVQSGTQGMVAAGTGTTGSVATYYWSGTAWINSPDFDVDVADSADVYWLDLIPNPVSNTMQAVFIDSESDLGTAYWNGTSWAVTANIDTAVDAIGSSLADFAWLPDGSSGRLVWDTDGGGSTLSVRTCSPQCTSATTTISTYYGLGAWLNLYRNPTAAETVDILGIRMNNGQNLGSFYFDGTSFTNYGDTAIASSTGSTAYNSFSFDFQRAFDNVPPIYSNVNQSYNEIYQNDTNYLSAYVYDNVQLKRAILETNETGVWENKSIYSSPVNLYGNISFVNFTWQNSSISDAYIGWRIWIVDRSNNVNVTPIYTFRVVPKIYNFTVTPEYDSFNVGNNSYKDRNFTLNNTGNQNLSISCSTNVSWAYNITECPQNLLPNQTINVTFRFNATGLALGEYLVNITFSNPNVTRYAIANVTVVPGITPSIYTDKTSYGTCNNIYFKVSVYDVNDQLIDTTLNNGLLDATNTTVYNESVTTGNGGSGIYLGVIAIPSGYNSGNWILRAISGNIKAQKALNVS